MPRKISKPEDVWNDRFQSPDSDALEAGLQDSARDLFAKARARLDELDDTSCSIKWLGVPWRWSLVYTMKGADEVLAYLVPEPGKPQICVPMDYDALERVASRRLSRTIRDGIVFAAEVGGTRWASWELQSDNQIEEILTLVNAKLPATA